MENKNNFTGIIIPVVVAVILLTVLPIINSINGECPPCEECPSYNIGNIEVNPNFASGNYIVDKGSYDYIDSATIIKDVDLIPENIKKDVNIFGVVGTYEETGGSSTYEYVLPVIGDYDYYDEYDNIHLTILFGLKNSQTTINGEIYYPFHRIVFINYELVPPNLQIEDYTNELVLHGYYYIFWEDFTENTLTIQAPLNPIDYECLGIFYATEKINAEPSLSFTNEVAYKFNRIDTISINNGNIFINSYKTVIAEYRLQGITRYLIDSDNTYYIPKLGTHELYVLYDE